MSCEPGTVTFAAKYLDLRRTSEEKQEGKKRHEKRGRRLVYELDIAAERSRVRAGLI